MTDTNNTDGAALLPVTIPDEIWRKVDELSRYTAHNTIMEWAEYTDRLRCALAETLLANQSHPLPATQEDAERSGAGEAKVEAYILERIEGDGYGKARTVIDALYHDPTSDGYFVDAEAKARHRITPLYAPQRQEYDGEAGAIETTGCNYCGAQVALMGADYLERIAEALDAAGAPRKSTDGLVHFGLIDRIAALNPAQATPSAVSVLVYDDLAKGLRTSQKALDEIARQEQANIAGYLALRDFPVGSASAQFPPDDVGPNALGADGRSIAAQLREISRISNKYDLRECIEGHDDALGDSYIWRDLMEQCEKLGNDPSAVSGEAGEGQ